MDRVDCGLCGGPDAVNYVGTIGWVCNRCLGDPNIERPSHVQEKLEGVS